MDETEPEAAPHEAAHPLLERFVFPYADWAVASEAELSHLGYLTNLRPRDDGVWVLEVTGPTPMMRALTEAAADDRKAGTASSFPCWVTWRADPDSDEAAAARRLGTLSELAAIVDGAARREQALSRLDAALQL